MDYSKFISKMSANRKPSGISAMRTYLKDASPSLIFLSSGIPNPEKFPFKKATITLDDGKTIKISPETMATALQYGATPGYAPLLKQLKEMTQKVHNPPRWDTSDVIVTIGCQDAMAKAMEMLLDPGDSVIVEEPCYSDALIILAPVTPTFLKVESDSLGMRPESLKEILEKSSKGESSKKPKVMYIVPNASNPSGTTMPEDRKRKIYSLASKYDIIILEDDPYYYLQYDSETPAPSFLNLDVDGRVIRFDSFSKIVCAGLRVGYATGPKELLERIVWHMHASCLCPPGITQVMVSELLKEWGDEGFKKHIAELRRFYKAQRDVMLEAAETHLKGLCEWTVPTGGIFIWFKVLNVRDTETMIKKRAVKKDIILLPGNIFMLDDKKKSPYMRASYSSVTHEQIRKGIKSLGELIREEIEIQNSASA